MIIYAMPYIRVPFGHQAFQPPMFTEDVCADAQFDWLPISVGRGSRGSPEHRRLWRRSPGESFDRVNMSISVDASDLDHAY